jgi:WD40 repeat protein
VWNTVTCDLVRKIDLRGQHGYKKNDVRTVSFDTSGKYLLCGSDDGRIRWTSVTADSIPMEFDAGAHWVTAMAASGNGATILTGHESGKVHKWLFQDGQLQSKEQFLDTPHGAVRQMALSRDGRFLATCGAGCVRLWRLDRFGEIDFGPGALDNVNGIAFGGRRELFVLATNSGSLICCRLPDKKIMAKLTGHKGRIECVAACPTHDIVLSGGSDKTARVWITTAD